MGVADNGDIQETVKSRLKSPGIISGSFGVLGVGYCIFDSYLNWCTTLQETKLAICAVFPSG